MATEEALLRLVFGIEKDAVILNLNFQDGMQIASLICPESKSDEYTISLDKFAKIQKIKTDINTLPFQNNTFEAIILKGFATNLNLPKKNQRIIFKNIFNLLEPGGIFYLAIENKYSPSFWAKNKASLFNKHRKSKNINNIFDKYLQLIHIKQTSLSHLLSCSGYINLMKEIGITDNFIYGAPVSLNDPCVLSLEKSVYNYYCQYLDSPRKTKKKLVIRLLNVLGANKFFCNSYILGGCKSEI